MFVYYFSYFYISSWSSWLTSDEWRCRAIMRNETDRKKKVWTFTLIASWMHFTWTATTESTSIEIRLNSVNEKRKGGTRINMCFHSWIGCCRKHAHSSVHLRWRVKQDSNKFVRAAGTEPLRSGGERGENNARRHVPSSGICSNFYGKQTIEHWSQYWRRHRRLQPFNMCVTLENGIFNSHEGTSHIDPFCVSLCYIFCLCKLWQQTNEIVSFVRTLRTSPTADFIRMELIRRWM